MSETLKSGGLLYDASWLICQATASFKPNEAFVQVEAEDVSEPRVSFYVDRELVRPDNLQKEAVSGQVKVIVVERNGGTSKVSVPGEPLSFGPQIWVRNELLS